MAPETSDASVRANPSSLFFVSIRTVSIPYRLSETAARRQLGISIHKVLDLFS